MSAWVETGARLLLQAAATLPDTIVTKQVETDPGLFSKFTSIASGVMTVALTVLTIFLVPAAWRFRHTHKKISEMLDKVYGDVNPLMRHASAIADNVDFITTSIRVDVQQVNQTVALANERLLHAVKQAERRMRELEALVDVAQTEAESVFVSAASTIRGVRAGAASFGAARRARLDTFGELDAERGFLYGPDDMAEEDFAAELADDEADGVLDDAEVTLEGDRLADDAANDDDDDDLADGFDETVDAVTLDAGSRDVTLTEEEDGDGYDDAGSAAGRGPERQRIRPRRGLREPFGDALDDAFDA